MRSLSTLRSAWLTLTLLPGLLLVIAAVLVDGRQRDAARLDRLASDARIAAEAIDLRLGKLLELTAFCASSPSLLEQVDLVDFARDCGRYATLIGAWAVVVELGETHRQVLNTRTTTGAPLPEYPRAGEFATLLELEARTRAGGTAGIAEVFTGPIARSGVITAGQYIRLADGRDAMLYISTDVGTLSGLLANLAGAGEAVFTLIDPSRRIVARSADIDRYLFAEAPVWMTEALETGTTGALLDQPGPEAIGGTWDVGHHPPGVAPGWMAVAVMPRSEGFLPSRLTAVPLGLALLGLMLSGLSIWALGYRDRTERRLAEAERSNREKSRLLASLAHDIRTPIVSLLGALELAEEGGSPGPAPARTARRSAETLLQLVDDILELSFLGSEAYTLTSSPVDLERLAKDVIEEMRDSAMRRGLALRLDVTGPLPPAVEVDRLRLGQVLRNLLSNAIKYTETGTVALQLLPGTRDGGKLAVTFAVADTGAGIAPKDIPRVFREFGRLDRAVVSREPGTGLGLPICQRILRGMGSELSLESAPGKGSTFSFTLRLPVAAVAASDEAGQPLAGVTILYAEDEPVIRRVTARRLAMAGAEVIEAEDGAAALEHLTTRVPDLLLLDLQMPGLDGVDTLRRLSAGDVPVAFPVFVLTSHISGPRAAEARAAGADEIFTKPVQILPLAAALRARRGGHGAHTPALGAAPERAEEPVIDVREFQAVAETSAEECEEIILPRFRRDLRTETAQLGEALSAGRVEEARRIAHRVRGLCQVLGARQLAARFKGVEDALERDDAAMARQLFVDTEVTLETTLQEMTRLVRDLAQGGRGT
jgi:signal transduction histidine kinase/DNA-binding response OmpR family regulator